MINISTEQGKRELAELIRNNTPTEFYCDGYAFSGISDDLVMSTTDGLLMPLQTLIPMVMHDNKGYYVYNHTRGYEDLTVDVEVYTDTIIIKNNGVGSIHIDSFNWEEYVTCEKFLKSISAKIGKTVKNYADDREIKSEIEKLIYMYPDKYSDEIVMSKLFDVDYDDIF